MVIYYTPMSTHKSFKASKRSSKSYTVTRDDRKLDPRDGQWRDGLKVKPIPCGARGTKRFRLQLENSTDRICGLDSFADELRTAGLNLHVSAVENVMNTLLEVIPRYIAKTGCAVRLGNLVTLKACVTGTLDSTADEPDTENNHVEIRATASPALRHSLARIKLVNVERRRNVIDKVIREMDNAESDVVDTNHNIMVSGRHIYVPPQSEMDENTRGSVWIETLNGEWLGRCVVLESGQDLLTVRFVPDKTVDECEARIVLETYGTKAAAEAGDESCFARYTREVKVVKA